MNYECQRLGQYAFMDDEISSPDVEASEDVTYGYDDPEIAETALAIAETEAELASMRRERAANIGTSVVNQFGKIFEAFGKKSSQGDSRKDENYTGPLVLGGAAVLGLVAFMALNRG